MTDASDLSRRSRWLAVALAEPACAKADPTHPLHRFDDSRFTIHDSQFTICRRPVPPLQLFNFSLITSHLSLFPSPCRSLSQRSEPVELPNHDRIRSVYLLLEHGTGQLSALRLKGLFVGIELRLGATQDPIFSRSGIDNMFVPCI